MHLVYSAVIWLLIFFLPLSFGAVQPWAQLILVCCSCLLMLLLPFKNRSLAITKPAKPIYFIIAFLFLLAAAQSLNIKTIFTAPFWIPFTISPLDTLDFAGYILTLGGFFIIASQTYQRHSSVKRLCFVISISGLLTALIGFSSGKGEYINFFTGIGYVKETFGPYLNRNHAAVFLNLCFFASLAWVVPFIIKQQKEGFYIRKSELIIKCLPPVLLSVFIAGGVIFSRSRGGILALTCGIFFYIALLLLFNFKHIRTKVISLSLLAALFVGMGFLIVHNAENINKFSRRDGENWGYSVETRKNLYNAGYYMLMDYKTFGIGFNAFSAGIYTYLDKPINAYVEHIHNDWLELAAGGGLLCVAALLSGILWFMFAAYKRLRKLPKDKFLTFCAVLSAVFSMALASFFDFHLFIPSNAILFFIMLGLAASPTFSKDKLREIKITPVFSIAFTLLFLPFVLLSFNKAHAWRLTSFAKVATGKNKIVLFEKALKKYPHPRNALRLAIAQYNISNDRDLPLEERKYFRLQARNLSADYLQHYPLYKEILNIHNKSI